MSAGRALRHERHDGFDGVGEHRGHKYGREVDRSKQKIRGEMAKRVKKGGGARSA